MVEPLYDTMDVRIEEKVRDLMLADDDLSALAVAYRGDPFLVPSSLHPFAYVFVTADRQATQADGYKPLTGPTTFWAYEGVVQVEVLGRDAFSLAPDAGRRADVASYTECRALIKAARRAVYAWGGPGRLTDPVVSADAKETTIELRVGGTQNGVLTRGDNVTNVGVFSWTVFTRKEEF